MPNESIRASLFAGIAGAFFILLSILVFYKLFRLPFFLRLGISIILFLLLLLFAEFWMSRFYKVDSIDAGKDREIERFVEVNNKFFAEREKKKAEEKRSQTSAAETQKS